MNRQTSSGNRGIILLVVLGMLTFFSLLIAAYLVFSSQAREASFAMSARKLRQPEPNAILNEALMTLVRGTDDVDSPFFGEDLLSDYYGRTDFLALIVSNTSVPVINANVVTIRMAADASVTGGAAISSEIRDDIYAGRVITFLEGGLAGRSFRVLRSITTAAGVHDLVFEIAQDITAAEITNGGRRFRMNGVPRNSPGLGFDGTNINQLARLQTFGPTAGDAYALPGALQPRHFFNEASSRKSTLGGDFDEGYDASDYNNWFLSYRHDDVAPKIIPSFHRPAVINYILNAQQDWNAVTVTIDDFRKGMVNIARGTLRPLPIAADQFGPSIPDAAMNAKFTGGNPNFALRTPILVNNAPRLDQLARVLIGTVSNPWDVDNDSDGINDSVWIDVNLPVFTSPEGKLLKPLIAPMIEDLSARLNVNTHGNFATISLGNGTNRLVDGVSIIPGTGLAGNVSSPTLFRGLGMGPADINIPIPPTVTASTAPNILSRLWASRYRPTPLSTDTVPGVPGADPLSAILYGRRPASLRWQLSPTSPARWLTGYGSSLDPYGRSGTGISTNGNLVGLNVGSLLTNDTSTTNIEPDTNESIDNPYEFDPTGKLGSDNRFTEAELEPLLRSNDFDSSVLPSRLQELLRPILDADPGLARALTTVSRSDDTPSALDASRSPYDTLAALIFGSGTLTQTQHLQLKQLIAPEIRLGRKLDVNRAFGNGVDDIDTATGQRNSVIDEPEEVRQEIEAFATLSGATIDAAFQGQVPDYNFDATAVVSGRQLLARHLYVLMMALSREIETNFPTFGDTLSPAVPVSDRPRYRARRIAQWAVNVVDYRDSDSIMTAFEYDENLTDGWSVDGDLNTNDGAFRGVVWGVEKPELVFSESLALHNLNVADTNVDSTNRRKGTGGSDDDDTDQVRVPQGSLFLELYCPRTASPISPPSPIAETYSSNPLIAGVPQELYHVSTPDPTNPETTTVGFELDLDRTVTTTVGAVTSETPVWRIAISEPHSVTFPANANAVDTQRLALPDTLSFEPSRLDELDFAATPTNSLQLERFVFFTQYATPVDLQNAIAPLASEITNSAQVFFNRSGVNAAVGPEQYVSIVPRTRTTLGSRVTVSGPLGPSQQTLTASITAGAAGLIHRSITGTPLTPATGTAIRPGVAIVTAALATPWTNAATTAPEGIGLNVSEPLPVNAGSYYAEPTVLYSTAVAGYTNFDAYVRLDAGGAAAAGAALDQPEDMRLASSPIRVLTEALSDPATVADPMLGSIEDYRTAFLQRLADPTRGYDPVLNPYRTVDQIAIDLTVFSGESNEGDVTKPGEAPSTPPFSGNYFTGSRERNGVGQDGVGTNILFSYNTAVPSDEALDSDPARAAFFQFLNAAATPGGSLATTFNFLNRSFGTPQTSALNLNNLGRPSSPFVVHPWLNREFATPLELMMVPACSQGRLFEEFSVIDPASTTDPPVYPRPIASPPSSPEARVFVGPFRHLLNFFHGGELTLTGVSPAAEFGSLFELVTTRHLFNGELNVHPPATIAVNPNLSPLLSPPFNFSYDNRRLGRINLNTLSDFSTWQGLMQGHLNSSEYTTPSSLPPDQDQLAFDAFLTAQRGYAVGSTSNTVLNNSGSPINYDATHFDSRYPSEFVGIFKRTAEARYAPVLRDLASTADNDSLEMRRRPIHANLLRGQGTRQDQEALIGPEHIAVPMFVRNKVQLPVAATSPFADRNTNAFMRYQTLMRMPNLVSDNSQVFLIRLTLGFFEVNANNTDDLGAEYNEDIGTNQRYQALFIVDRSIPVGFVPGQDLNTRDTVIFERFYQ